METLTLSYPHSFLHRGMSPAFDGGVGGRYTNRSHPTPVVPRATFPTTFERDGTHLPAVHQESRPDATASAIIDRRLTLSQTTSTGSRGRGEIAFYRSQQHQPANVGSSVMLDTIEHQPHQTLQASPRGSPQALPIRSLAQVGPSGGLPSVRQLERVAELGEAATASTFVADSSRRSPDDETSSSASKRRRMGDSPISPVVGQPSRSLSSTNSSSEWDLLSSTSPRSRSLQPLSSPSSASPSRRSSEQRAHLSQLLSPWTGPDAHRNRDGRAQTMPATVQLQSSTSQSTSGLPAHPLEISHLRSLTLPSIPSMHLRREPYLFNQPSQPLYVPPPYPPNPLTSNPPAPISFPQQNQLPSNPLPPIQLGPGYYQEGAHPSQRLSNHPQTLHAPQQLHYFPSQQTLPPYQFPSSEPPPSVSHPLVWPPHAQSHLPYRQPYPNGYAHQLHYESQEQGQVNPEAHVPRRRRGNLPKEATTALKEWFLKNESNPYPTEEEKAYLVGLTGLSHSQVNNWFINARRRFPRSGNKPSQQRASTGSILSSDHPDPAQRVRGGSHRPTLTEGVIEQEEQEESSSHGGVVDDLRDDSPDPLRGQMVDRDERQNFSKHDELRRSRSPPTLKEHVDRGYGGLGESQMFVDEASLAEPSNPRGIMPEGFDESA